MTREEARNKIKAAAYVAADAIGANEAARLLREAANEIEKGQWEGNGNR